MISFKPKPVKTIKPEKKSSVTLDCKHSEFLNEFSNDEHVVIPKLKKQKCVFMNKLNEKDLGIDEKLDIIDNISKLTNEIKGLKKKKKDYFLNNSKYIFEYFENKKNISNEETENVVTSSTKNMLHD